MKKKATILKSVIKTTCFIIFILLMNCSSKDSEAELFSENQIQSIGSRYSSWFYSSKLELMIKKILDPNYKLSELRKFRAKVERQFGVEQEILNVQFGKDAWQYYYVRYSRFDKVNQPVRTLFTFNEKEMIKQFSVISLPNEAPTQYNDYTTKTRLTLPFKGEWFVAWGGRTINENQHAVSKEQRYAYDFLIRKGCKTFKGKGEVNTDYYCYEQEVLAPGSGQVVEIVDDIVENQIGKMPEIHGNRIVIDHGNNEYSVLSHFKKGSIIVKKNDLVERGQLLGLCGNSGHSSEPHIHYHLQNTADIDNGEGLPIQFWSYKSNGEFTDKGEPKIGERVKNKLQ